ncbi:MAG TPA: acetate uptake transporter [Candidatus Acidoferrales bacterium]|nr:acetate uptake transporter [Candidatus Acidoferrales bacterium]
MQASVRETLHEIWTKAGPVDVAAAGDGELRRIEERRQVEVGEPGAMGLFGFAVGTLVIAFVLSGITPMSSMTAALPAVLVFAGVGQFIAGLIAFAKGNTFAGTAFCSYGANNTLVSAFILGQKMGLIGATPADSHLLGVGLLCFGYISLILAIAATRLNATFVAILLALVPGYVLAAIPDLGGSATIGNIGGYFLILAAGLAFYGASALVINSTHERNVLNMGKM